MKTHISHVPVGVHVATEMHLSAISGGMVPSSKTVGGRSCNSRQPVPSARAGKGLRVVVAGNCRPIFSALDDCFLAQAVRTVFNIAIGADSADLQRTARSALLQMLNTVVKRIAMATVVRAASLSLWSLPAEKVHQPELHTTPEL